MFNKTEVECQHAINDMLNAVVNGAECYDNYHLPGNNATLFTAATCDLQFVYEYTPKVGDYCTVSTHTFPEYMKHVVEICYIRNRPLTTIPIEFYFFKGVSVH